MVDPNRGDFPVFETAAILQYLVVHYDPEGERSNNRSVWFEAEFLL